MKLKFRFFATGLALGIIATVLTLGITKQQAQAVVGTLDISGTSQTLTGDVTAARLVDSANSAYLIDPAATGTSLYTAGAATVSGQFTAANTFTFKSVSATELGLYDSTNTLLVSFDEGN